MFKVGDYVKTRQGLLNANLYGGVFYSDIMELKDKRQIIEKKGDMIYVKGNYYTYTKDMLDYADGKKRTGKGVRAGDIRGPYRKRHYKVGDLVIVRGGLVPGNKYKSHDGEGVLFVEEMLEYCGKVFTISEIDRYQDYLLNGCDKWVFSYDMLMPITPRQVREMERKKAMEESEVTATNDTPVFFDDLVAEQVEQSVEDDDIHEEKYGKHDAIVKDHTPQAIINFVQERLDKNHNKFSSTEHISYFLIKDLENEFRKSSK